MPGSWEIAHHQSILIGILHTDLTSVAWSFGLRNLQVPGQIIPVAGMPYDHARNSVCMRALEGGFDYVGFLDSDVVPPNDAFVRLVAHRQPIISGVYCRRSPPCAIPVMIKDGQWVTQYPQNSVIEVDVVGAGCLVIHRSVLESLPPQRPGKHWFDWRVDMRGTEGYPDHECMSEDFTLCHHARKHGYRVLVDTGVQCRHVGMAQAKYAAFEPLDTTPVT